VDRVKKWLSGSDLAGLKLAGLPTSKSGLYSLIERQGWNHDPARSRQRTGRGGSGFEYRVAALPELARLDYAKRQLNAAAKGARGACAQMASADATLDGRAGEERDARLQLVATCDRFRVISQMSVTAADDLFVRLYNRGEIDVSQWVKDCVSKISMRSMARWRAAARKQETDALAHDPAKARKGTGVLDRALDGQLRATALAMLAANPHFTAKHVRTYLKDTYGDALQVTTSDGVVREVPMPPLRTVQATVARWREEHRAELLKLSDPDGFRSSMQYALRVGAQANHPNALWQIDASPCDVMTLDGGKNGNPGRANLYACIDVYTRRTVFLVSNTPTAAALGLLIRKALLAWGVPDVIKSDNGSDFTAKFIERLLDNLGVEHDLCTPFQPQQKGMVERVFRTLQHDLMVTLPGFIGHNVGDRSVIESRKAFAQRLGEAPDALAGAALTNLELAERIDAWTRDDYEQRPHGGLRDRTPFEVAASHRGAVRRIEDEAALMMLLAPVPGQDGMRTVTKTGIRINHADYYSTDCMPGDRVFCRMDPADAGQIYLFSEDGLTFLGEAVSPELSGHNPQELIARVKAAQKDFIAEGTGPLRKEARRIKPTDIADAMAREAAADAGKLVSFPKPKTPHSTDALRAAATVERRHEPSALPEDVAANHKKLVQRFELTGSIEPVKVKPIREDSANERFRKALRLEARMAEGNQVKPDDALWLGRYQTGSEYRAMKKMVADFGEQMLGKT
jgi:transposase InsO family protein